MRRLATMGLAVAALVAAGTAGWVAAGTPADRVIRITARRYQYDPPRITLRLGEPVVLELTSLDRRHGFSVPELGLRADILPDETVRVRIVPTVAGTFVFGCDVFCGAGHDDMAGTIEVTE